ncbi:MAG: SPFH domain-containing protein, partial [Leifsonia sp.]
MEMSLMVVFTIVLVIVVIVAIILFFMSIRVVKQYERGVVLRFGKLQGTREPGLRFIVPVAD